MSRRSSRLAIGGYYNSDEESDSSSVTVSYRENPVKVFKKKAGTRKAGSRTPSKASSNATPASSQPHITADQYDGLSPSTKSSQTESAMRTVPYMSTVATPRPALTPSSTRSQTPTCCTSLPPEKSAYTGISSSSRLGLHLRPNHMDPSQSAVDSSGYSSSEGTHRKLIAATASHRIHSGSGAPSTGYRSRISSAFLNLRDSISLMAVAAQSKIMHLTALANSSFSGHMKKACGLFLLLLIILLCIWFLLPLLTSLISRMVVTKSLSQTKPTSQPVIPVTPPPQFNTVHPTPVVDPAVVSAVVEAKMQHLMAELQVKQEELQLKQERLLSQNSAVVSAAVEAKMQRLMEELRMKQEELQLKQERLLSQEEPAVVSAAIDVKMQHFMEELLLKQEEQQLKQERLLSRDASIVPAAVEAKMQGLLAELRLKQEELQIKQERLLSQMKERLQLDVQDMKAKLEVVDSDRRLRLEQELAGLGRQMLDHQTDSHSTAASLSLRIQTLEAQNAKLSQEWSSIQLMPPTAPCPDTSTNPVHNHLTPELQQAMEKWLTDRIKEQDAIRLSDKGSCSQCGRPMADKMADFALETQGASVISTRCSETYRIRSACVTLFGFPLWYPSESPRTVIQGYPVLLPGKCWAFHGVQGTLVISLSHPVMITHVTLDHLPRYNSPTGRIDSAPKDFEVYGMKNDTEEGTLLGRFMYDENGESTQTFKLPSPSDAVYRVVELRVLTNWGHVEYTCLYRFRVHGQIAST